MPVRKPTIPDRISRLLSEGDNFIRPERKEPMLAPEVRAGAKTPPAAPVEKEMIDPLIRTSGAYQGRYLLLVNSTLVIISLPELMRPGLLTKAIRATASP